MLMENVALETPAPHAGPIAVDVDHVTSFAAIVPMAVTRVGGIGGRVRQGVMYSVEAIGRKEKLIRITLIQKQKSYSIRLTLMEVEILP